MEDKKGTTYWSKLKESGITVEYWADHHHKEGKGNEPGVQQSFLKEIYDAVEEYRRNKDF